MSYINIFWMSNGYYLIELCPADIQYIFIGYLYFITIFDIFKLNKMPNIIENRHICR